MTTYLVHDGTRAVSIGSVLADPLPAGLTAVALSDAEAAAARDGRVSWNGAVVVADPPPPPPPTPEERLDAAVAALATVDTITAPVVTADVLDILAATRAALEA